jgi:hypothetical protein
LVIKDERRVSGEKTEDQNAFIASGVGSGESGRPANKESYKGLVVDIMNDSQFSNDD